MAMFGYMTDTGTVEPLQTVEVETQGNWYILKGKLLYGCAMSAWSEYIDTVRTIGWIMNL